MAAKKQAKRLLKRVNGVLSVVYVDVETGQVLPNLDGYELITQGGTEPAKVEEKAPAQQEQSAALAPRESNDPSPDDYSPEQHEINRNRPLGSGNILKDLPGAFKDFQGKVQGIQDGIKGAVGGLVGRVVGENVGKDIAGKGLTGAGEAVRGVGAGIQDAATGLGDSIKGGIANIFGAGSTPANGAYSPLQNPKGVNLNPQLQQVLNEAALRSPYSVVVKSGERPGDSRQHGKNNAVDINLVNPDTGEVIPDYQDGPSFRVYEQFAQTARTVQQNMYPELDADLRWGGYFTANGSPKGYGAADLMHFDLAGQTVGWGAGGNWETGAASVLKQAYPGLESRGMGTQKWAMTQPGVSPVEEIRVAEEAKHSATPAPAVQTAQAPIAAPPGVDPKLVAAVQARKTASKQVQPPATATAAVAPVTPAPTPVPGTPAPMSTAAVIPPAQQTAVPQGFDYTLPNQSRGNVDVAEAALNRVQPGPTMVAQAEPMAPAPKITQGFMDPGVQNKAVQGATEDPTRYLDTFLDTINYAEGSPRENQLFGYGEFDDFSSHPNKPIAYNDGQDFSTAAGLFQINKDTYDDFAGRTGISTFDRDSQYELARNIATTRYKEATGRDLGQDLMSGDRTLIEGAYTNLKGTWSSLPGGSQQKSVMDDLVSRFEAGTAYKPASTKDIGATSGVKTKNSAFAEPISATSVVKKSDNNFAAKPSAMDKSAAKVSASSSNNQKDTGIGASTFKTTSGAASQAAKAASKTSSSGGSFAPKPDVVNNPKTNGSSFAPAPAEKNKTNQVTTSNTKTDNTSKDKEKSKTK